MKKCCVLIPYYNAGDSLLESIESIDYKHIKPDIIVVDDGSRAVKASDIIRKYTGPLNINLLELKNNKGIEHALNYGLSTYGNDYEFIARLDCGDLCQGNRFEKQIKYLEDNELCYLIGSWVEFTDMNRKILYTVEHPSDYETIKNLMFLNATFTHPSVMFRSKIIKTVGLYPTDCPAAEDYAYFFQIIKKHHASNIEESLVSCTVDPNGISTKKRKIQIKSRISVIIKNFSMNKFAFYGLFRSAILLHTPRSFTIYLKKILQ